MFVIQLADGAYVAPNNKLTKNLQGARIFLGKSVAYAYCRVLRERNVDSKGAVVLRVKVVPA